MMPILETERLLIKAGTIEDYVKVHEYDFNYLMDIEGIFEFVKRDPNEVRGWFNNSIENFYSEIRKKNQYNFIIYLKDSLIPIGNISFDRNDEKLKSTEISNYLHPNYWGNGYIKEALIKCMEYLFNHGFENIIYAHDIENKRSKALCEKIGFEFKRKYQQSNFNGGKATLYEYILSKERFDELYMKREYKSK